MRTPLQTLTEIVKHVKAKRTVYHQNAQKCEDEGFRESAVGYAMQAASMKEILGIIEGGERGR